MIAAKHQQKLFLFFMTLLMSPSLSVVLFLLEGGVNFAEPGTAIAAWYPRFLKIYVAVLPAVIIISPIAKKLTTALVARPQGAAG